MMPTTAGDTNDPLQVGIIFFQSWLGWILLLHVLSLLIKDDNWSNYATPCLNPWKFPITHCLKLTLLNVGYRPRTICPFLPFECHHLHFLLIFLHPHWPSCCFLNLQAWSLSVSGSHWLTCNHPRSSPAAPVSQVLVQITCPWGVCDHPVWRVLAVTLQLPCFFITFVLCHHVKLPCIVDWIVSPKFMVKS